MTGIITDIKTAWATAAALLGSSVAMIADAIPDDIGKIAVLLGMGLTSVLIRVHWRQGNKALLELEKMTLEVEILKREHDEND